MLIASTGRLLELVIVITAELEVTFPEGRTFTTTTVSAPGVAIIPAGIIAPTVPLVTEVTVTGVPPTRTTALANPLPVMMTPKPGPPAEMLLGVMLEMKGKNAALPPEQEERTTDTARNAIAASNWDKSRFLLKDSRGTTGFNC